MEKFFMTFKMATDAKSYRIAGVQILTDCLASLLNFSAQTKFADM